MSDQPRGGGVPQQRRPGQPVPGRPGANTGRVPRVPAQQGSPNAPRPPMTGAKVPPGAGRPGPRPGGPVPQGGRKPGVAGPATATQGRAKPGQGPRPAAAAPGKKPAATGKLSKGGKRAQLRITRLDLLAVMKMSFLFAFCVSVVMFTALFVLWNILVSSGAIDNLQSMIGSVMGDAEGNTSSGLTTFLTSSRVLGFITGVSVINVFILTFLGTLFGALYNTAAVLFGGLEVTLEV